MQNIKIYIITRFNLPLYKSIPAFNKDKYGNLVYNESWLIKRFKLFETYCLPSLANQVYKDFTWLCLFDKDTAEKWKIKIDKYYNTCSNFRACYLNLEETNNLTDYLSDYIVDDIKNLNISHVVTVRLDNDDSLNVSMLDELIKKLSNSLISGYYSFRYGIQYFTKYNSIKGYYFQNNHFLARLEKKSNYFKTVLDCSHTQVKIQRIFNNKTPMWAEIVHDSNIINEVAFNKNIIYLIKEILCSAQYKNLKLFGLNNIQVSSISFLISFKLLFRFIQTAFIRKLNKTQ